MGLLRGRGGGLGREEVAVEVPESLSERIWGNESHIRDILLSTCSEESDGSYTNHLVKSVSQHSYFYENIRIMK